MKISRQHEMTKECYSQNMTTTTNKDDLVSCSPTQLRFGALSDLKMLGPSGVVYALRWSVRPSVSPSVQGKVIICSGQSEQERRRQSLWTSRPHSSDQLLIIYICPLLFTEPTELLAEELTGGCDCHHTNTTF